MKFLKEEIVYAKHSSIFRTKEGLDSCDVNTQRQNRSLPERLLWVRKRRVAFYFFYFFEASGLEQISHFRAEVSMTHRNPSHDSAAFLHCTLGLRPGSGGWAPPTGDEAAGIGGHMEYPLGQGPGGSCRVVMAP